jgi:hypothetical protein
MPDRDEMHSGHRQRLRERFLACGARDLSAPELLELLLTYAIPRRDVAPLACQLLERFGDLPGVLAASHEQLTSVPGIGEQAALMIQIVAQIAEGRQTEVQSDIKIAQQSVLAGADEQAEPSLEREVEQETFSMRTFTIDLSTTALEYLPEIVRFDEIEDYQRYLEERLPYNSLITRRRYARYLINRYYPDGQVRSPLTDFFSHRPAPEALRSVLFYETVRAEPTVQFVTENIIWPAVPLGHLSRAQLRERLESVFPEASTATIKRMLYALFNVYTELNLARADDDVLRFQIHRGTFEAFLYVLTAEFPQPGMYHFEQLEGGPMRHWLLWDREWMHQQLYNLRDFGILSKVSQIDTLRQFTLQFDQWTALRHYFEHPERDSLALRERSEIQSNNRGDDTP